MAEVPLNRVCIVMMSAVGDAVHVLPVVNAIERHYPASRITWVLQPGPASLIRGHPAVDEIIVFERKKGMRAFLEAGGKLREREFDVVLCLQTYLKAGLLTAIARSPVKLGFDRARSRDMTWLFTNRKVPARPVQHMQDQYLEFLTALDIPVHEATWRLGPWPDERAWQNDYFSAIERPVVTCVIGTSNPAKDWIPERWAELIDVLREKYGLQPVLAGGSSPRERETERVINERAGQAPLSTLGIPLRQLVALLDGSALVISLDTGPLHMSVALDRPVIGLMGYNDPQWVGPYRRFQDLTVDAYHDPGEHLAPSSQHRPGRMDRIQVADVVEKVEVWQQRYRA
jgi:heptosyltransferase I